MLYCWGGAWEFAIFQVTLYRTGTRPATIICFSLVPPLPSEVTIIKSATLGGSSWLPRLLPHWVVTMIAACIDSPLYHCRPQPSKSLTSTVKIHCHKSNGSNVNRADDSPCTSVYVLRSKWSLGTKDQSANEYSKHWNSHHKLVVRSQATEEVGILISLLTVCWCT